MKSRRPFYEIGCDVIGLLGDDGQRRIRKALWDLYRKYGVRRLINETIATIQSMANDKYKLNNIITDSRLKNSKPEE